MGNLSARLIRESGGEGRGLRTVELGGPTGRFARRARIRRARRFSTGLSEQREHCYVQQPHHIEPPFSARPFLSQAYAVTVPGAGYSNVLVVGFGGNASVPGEYRAIIRQVTVFGVYGVAAAIDPALVGRWQLLKNGIAVDNLTELRPSGARSDIAQPAGAFTDLSPLHAPIKGMSGDVFVVQARTIGAAWIGSAIVAGWLYPQDMAGDSIRESWVDKPR